MSTPDCFLGVDGGGTKTRFALIDGEGRLLAQAQHGTTYHPQVAEVEALTSSNVALYKPVTASAAVGAGAPASALTDGISTTYSFPAGAAGTTLGFTTRWI